MYQFAYDYFILRPLQLRMYFYFYFVLLFIIDSFYLTDSSA